MKRAKRFAALALALALALSLAGCGAMEDVSRTLVQGNLDEIYLGKYSDEFLELVDITADEAERAAEILNDAVRTDSELTK